MDMREHLHSIPSNDQKIEFILDHPDKAAKNEIILRPVDSKDTTEEIFTIIESVFLVQETYSQLRQILWQCTEKKQRLLNIFTGSNEDTKRIAMREGSDFENRTKFWLTNSLILCTIQLKRELRTYAFEPTIMPFLEFRVQILRWIDDEPTSETSVKINKQDSECSTTNQELSQLLKKQQVFFSR